MSTEEWLPLSWREGNGPADGGWRGKVPVALEKPLRKWVRETLAASAPNEQRLVDRLLLRFNLVVPDRNGSDFLAYQTSVEVLVEVVDAVLDLLPVPRVAPDFVVDPPPGRPLGLRPGGVRGMWEGGTWTLELRGELVRLLGDARSVLRVRADGRGLERRPDSAAEASFEEAATVALKRVPLRRRPASRSIPGTRKRVAPPGGFPAGGDVGLGRGARNRSAPRVAAFGVTAPGRPTRSCAGGSLRPSRGARRGPRRCTGCRCP
jgi:hypothetical protein